MNKVVIVLIIALSNSFISCARSEVNVEYHGTLVDTPCQLDESSESLSIDFGELVNKDLVTNGKSKVLPLGITLIECDLSISNMLTIKFIGDQSYKAPNNLAIPGFDMLSVGFLNLDKDVPINKIYPLSIDENGKNVLKLSSYIQYSPVGSITTIPPGFFSSEVIFNIEYP